MVVQRLLTIKMREEEIVMAGYNVVDWTDERLSWNPEDYNNISVTNINSQLIWKPGTVFYNNKDGVFETKFKTKLKLYNTGYISWMPPALYKSTCSLNVKKIDLENQSVNSMATSLIIFFIKNRSTKMQFDFPIHRLCYGIKLKLKLTCSRSLALALELDARNLDFNYDFALETSYVEGSNVSAEWVLLRTNISIVDSMDSDLSFKEIHFEYHFQRMPLFYILNMILPIWLMFFLSIFVFYLPTDACEKMTLSISILIGQTVFLTLLAKHTPETSMEIPLLSSYLLFTIMMVSFSVIMSVVVCNVHFRSSATHKLPRYFQVIFIDYIARYLNIKRPPPFEIDMPRRNSHGEDTKTTSMCYELELEEDGGKAVASEIMFNTHSKLFGCSDRKAMSTSVRNTTRPLARELRPAVEAIDFITTTMQQNDDESTTGSQVSFMSIALWLSWEAFIISGASIMWQSSGFKVALRLVTGEHAIRTILI
ncbi:Oidioi.mRNA.OKI2018_I69.chr2.g7649.t1.cds [Oikopleura dioica]|uniref:Oidioi.mRNA.OKI2018_I69.chr2.g7649.t1.cds n=1 Tax=Oikopleura dioica TaxID=34765 RepID=A0ABN7TDF2_OIKDI|nr:Oidioi.mRNA.OKI2018_I69.chr2.g7649.t1.cds [Oikopleura dioica]